MKKYILFAGVNGAGKSTLYNTNDAFKGMERVNSDEIVKSFGDWKSTADSLEAGKIAIRKINELFYEGVTFNQETTLCGKAIIKNISRAKKLGYSYNDRLYLRDLKCNINLIPYNSVTHAKYKKPLKTTVMKFKYILEQSGKKVTIRLERGADIDAACGQLSGKVK